MVEEDIQNRRKYFDILFASLKHWEYQRTLSLLHFDKIFFENFREVLSTHYVTHGGESK